VPKRYSGFIELHFRENSYQIKCRFGVISYAVREYTFRMKWNILDNDRFWWELFH